MTRWLQRQTYSKPLENQLWHFRKSIFSPQGQNLSRQTNPFLHCCLFLHVSMLYFCYLLHVGGGTVSKCTLHSCTFMARHMTTRFRTQPLYDCSYCLIQTTGRCFLWYVVWWVATVIAWVFCHFMYTYIECLMNRLVSSSCDGAMRQLYAGMYMYIHVDLWMALCWPHGTVGEKKWHASTSACRCI